MGNTERIALFDRWAQTYDQSVQMADAFPFAGYETILNEITRRAEAQPTMQVLDIGIGTGNLAKRLVGSGCTLWGVDFSAEMLAKARATLPQAKLVQADILKEWPDELQRPFDRIVSAYVFHEFDLAHKIALLQKIMQHYCAPCGCVIIGDIAFPTAEIHAQARQYWDKSWDDDEYYWTADETLSACQQVGLQAHYTQLSACGGVFTIRPQDS
jgi:putative AdoMet-dependent methyltransferase